MQLAGREFQAAVVSGDDQLPGKSNYFIGNNPAKWHRDIPQFARVRYQGVYPGVDLVYYGNQGQLEYDFEVAPGADPKTIAFQFRRTAKTADLMSNGDLILAADSGEVRLKAPRIYQGDGSQTATASCRTILVRHDGRVGFEVAAYDRSRVLVIDPVLAYSTYLGGSGDESCSVITGVCNSTFRMSGGCDRRIVEYLSRGIDHLDQLSRSHRSPRPILRRRRFNPRWLRPRMFS